jgi:hypothetical protein
MQELFVSLCSLLLSITHTYPMIFVFLNKKKKKRK